MAALPALLHDQRVFGQAIVAGGKEATAMPDIVFFAGSPCLA